MYGDDGAPGIGEVKVRPFLDPFGLLLPLTLVRLLTTSARQVARAMPPAFPHPAMRVNYSLHKQPDTLYAQS